MIPKHKLYYFIIIAVIILICTLVVFITTCTKSPNKKDPKNIIFGIESDNGEVLVLKGSGEKLKQFNAVSGTRLTYKEAYFSPDISPDQNYLVMVYYKILQEEPEDRFPNDKLHKCYQLTLIDVNASSDERKVLIERETFIDSPVWNPSGKSIAFISGTEILLIEKDKGNILWKINVPDILEASPLTSNRGYLRWNNTGNILYLAAEKIDSPGFRGSFHIGVLEVNSFEFKWLDLETPRFFIGSHNYYGSPKFELAEDDPALIRLFGSVKNPVKRPVFSIDNRYYFYRTKKEGFLARGWIEGYSVDDHVKFSVKTLWRALYVE